VLDGAGTAAGVSVLEAVASVVVVAFFFLEKRDLSLLRGDSARVDCALVSCGDGGVIREAGEGKCLELTTHVDELYSECRSCSLFASCFALGGDEDCDVTDSDGRFCLRSSYGRRGVEDGKSGRREARDICSLVKECHVFQAVPSLKFSPTKSSRDAHLSG
jgi:hypothetical protein